MPDYRTLTSLWVCALLLTSTLTFAKESAAPVELLAESALNLKELPALTETRGTPSPASASYERRLFESDAPNPQPATCATLSLTGVDLPNIAGFNSAGVSVICSSADAQIDFSQITGCPEAYAVFIDVMNNDFSTSLNTVFAEGDITFPGNGIIDFNTHHSFTPGNWRIVCIIFDEDGNDEGFFWDFVLEPPMGQLSSLNTSYEVCTGNNLTLSVTGPGSLTWFKDGQQVGTGSSYQITSAQAGDAGVYTVSSNFICAGEATTEVIVGVVPTLTFNNNPTELCASEAPLQLEVQANPAGGVGSWTTSCKLNSAGELDPEGGNCDVSSWPYSFTISSLYTYSLNGCTVSGTVPVIYHKSSDLGLSTEDACDGVPNGSATIDPVGNSPFSQPTWYVTQGSNPVLSNGNYTIDGLAAGLGSVKMTDADGCENSEEILINALAPVAVNWSLTSQAPCGANSWGNQFGSGDVSWSGGAGAPYMMSIDGGSFFGPVTSPYTVNLEAGDHDIVIKDANDCEGEVTASIQALNDLDFATNSPSVTDAQCVGVNNGQIEVQVTGGTPNYTFNWNPGSGSVSQSTGTYTIGNLGASSSNYFVTVTDGSGSGCTIIAGPFNIGEASPPQWVPEFSAATPPTCDGVPNGQLTAQCNVSVGNCAPAYDFVWSNGTTELNTTTSTINDLTSGPYSLTMKDVSTGCKVSASVSLEPQMPSSWPKATGGLSSLGDRAEAIAIDAQDNVYVAGTFIETTTIDGFGLTAGNGGSGQEQALFLAKYDECGLLLWVQTTDYLGSSQNFELGDITLDGSNVYLLAERLGNSNFDFGGTALNNVLTTDNWFMVEVNATSGNVTGDRGFPTLEADDAIYDLEKICTGSVFYAAGRDDLNAAATIFTLDFAGGAVGMLIEDQATGSNSEFRDLEVDNNVLIATGTMYASANFSTNPGNIMNLAGGSDVFVMRGTLTGCTGFTWTHQVFSNNLGVGEGLALALDGPNNKVHVVGNYQGIMSNWNNQSSNMQNAYLVRLDESNLALDWISDVDQGMGITSARATDVVMDPDGDIVMAGSFTGTNIAITSGQMQTVSPGNAGGRSLWVATFDANQDIKWSLTGYAGTADDANPVALAAGAYSSYLVGAIDNDLTLDLSSVLLDHPNGGLGVESAFTLRLGSVLSGGQVGQFYRLNVAEESDQNKNMLLVYPNPTTDVLNVDVVENGHYQVMDVTGQVVLNGSVGQGSNALPVSELAPGTYLLHLTDGANRKQAIFVVR